MLSAFKRPDDCQLDIQKILVLDSRACILQGSLLQPRVVVFTLQEFFMGKG
jgi:hypothetical protein